MKFVADTDILSTFARIHRLDILKKISESIVISQAVKAELARGKIDVRHLDPDFTILTKDELKDLKKTDNSLDRGERECLLSQRVDVFLLPVTKPLYTSCARGKELTISRCPEY